MSAYIVFQETIHDVEAFEEYKKLSPESIKEFGGRFIVRGGPIKNLEGEIEHSRVVIIEFPDAGSARAWHSSSAYLPARELRLTISSGTATLVEGV